MGTSILLGDNLTKCWEVTCDGLVSHPGGVEILLVASYYRTQNIRFTDCKTFWTKVNIIYFSLLHFFLCLD